MSVYRIQSDSLPQNLPNYAQYIHEITSNIVNRKLFIYFFLVI